MDQENGTAAGQPNSHENGIKRPHQASPQNDHDHEPDVKRVRVDTFNDAGDEPPQPQSNSADDTKGDQKNTVQTEAKVHGEVADSRAVPKGTAVIKPE